VASSGSGFTTPAYSQCCRSRFFWCGSGSDLWKKPDQDPTSEKTGSGSDHPILFFTKKVNEMPILWPRIRICRIRHKKIPDADLDPAKSWGSLRIQIRKAAYSLLPVYVSIHAVCQTLVQEPVLAWFHRIVLLEREAPASVSIQGFVDTNLRSALESPTAGGVKELEHLSEKKTI
jgi:hypothetical protein